MSALAVFDGTCPACGEETRFVEIRMEQCLQPGEGPPKAWRGFRCFACGKRSKEVPAPDGLHRFEGEEHVVADGPG